jgi:hypothetical protein
MTASEIAELIGAMRGGSMSLEDLAELFRGRSWSRTRGPLPATYAEMAAAAECDPEPDIPGSFDEVVAAYDRGELSRAEYRVLSEAVADSIRAEEQKDG